MESHKTDLERTTEVQSRRAEAIKDPGWWDLLRSRVWAAIRDEHRETGEKKKVFSRFEIGKMPSGEPLVCTTIICGNAAIDQGFKFDNNGQLNGVSVIKQWLGEWEEEIEPTESPFNISPELKREFEERGGGITTKVGYKGPVKVSHVLMVRNDQGVWEVKEQTKNPNRLAAWNKEFQTAQSRLEAAKKTTTISPNPQPIPGMG